MLVFQGSLFEGVGEEPAVGPVDTGLRRLALSDGAWVDLRPGWLTGGGELFDALRTGVPWEAERRRMYDRTVDVPRLTRHYRAGEPLPHPLLVEAREALSTHYAGELGERSSPPACACTGTGTIRWPGTATPSAAAPPTTPWWPSSRWVQPGP